MPLRSQPHMHTISVGVESSEEGVLESCVLRRLLQVLVCILPAAEKMCSTPADEAGAAKCCLTILASAGHLRSFTFHQSRMGSSSSGISAVRQVLLELIELRRLLLLRLLLLHLAEEAAKAHLALLRVRLWDRIPNFGYTILTDGCVTW